MFYKLLIYLFNFYFYYNMLSIKNYYNNSSIYANTGTFNNLLINGVLTNDSLTNPINTISGNVNTISVGLNKLTNYIGINTISCKINLNCNKTNYNGLTVITSQTEFTNNIAIQQFINQIL